MIDLVLSGKMKLGLIDAKGSRTKRRQEILGCGIVRSLLFILILSA